jgi:6-phosphogluconolactonase (cycloisomerase 2 family)
MYVVGISGDDVNQYSLSTAWDISTASYVQNFSVSAQETAPRAIFFDPYGAGMYVLGTSSDDVNVYTVGGFSVTAQDTSPTDVSFKSDGTAMYVLGNGGDDVNQYSLSTAWDISTASYSQSFSISAQETVPQGMFFRTDGTKLYICGTSGDDVNEYSLSTAWDISTASYVRNESTAGYDNQPFDVAFKSDGTVMYVLGGFFDSVYQLDLSTAWDISTATLDSSKSIGSQTTSPRSVVFKPDGTVMYILSSSEEIFRYSLSTAWDVTTATLDQTFSYGASDSNPYGLFFKPDGSGFYIAGITNDRIYSYAIGEQ